MKPLSHDELRELAPAFVMGTLTSVDLADFNAAMADPVTAAELAPELEAHRAAVEFLATGHAVVPPPSLAQRLGARIAQEQAVSMRLAETAELPFRRRRWRSTAQTKARRRYYAPFACHRCI